MHITVGSSHDPSGVPSKVEVGQEVVLEAAPGGSTTKLRPDVGGDGYSGGGGSGAMGGSNGGDGEDGSSGGAGGRGSGLDVGALGSEKFSLVPGEGGITHSGCAGGKGQVTLPELALVLEVLFMGTTVDMDLPDVFSLKRDNQKLVFLCIIMHCLCQCQLCHLFFFSAHLASMFVALLFSMKKCKILISICST